LHPHHRDGIMNFMMAHQPPMFRRLGDSHTADAA
jgi:hypothetical protein